MSGTDVVLYEPCRHGCSCSAHEGYGCGARKTDGGRGWTTHPECRYHDQAAEQPWNHRIPWICGNYWDGCNCVGGPLYSNEMHVLAWMLRTALGWPWGTRVDRYDGTVHVPEVRDG